MKLCRYGKDGYEKPGIIDAQGKLRDLSKIIANIDASTLAPRDYYARNPDGSLVQVDNLVATLATLRARGVRCLAAHPRPGARKLAAVDLRGDCCLLFGAEGPGLTAAALDACDEAVEIPMPSHMNSVNVASATAVFLYEATRQRDRAWPG